ncbi:phage integrase SAM-like domain-containing protein, partial [Clostridium perfringens]
MAGKRTLKQQLFNAVDSRYKVGKGRSKHQDKKNGEIKHDIIYSKNEMERLKDISTNFSKFVREKHPELWRTQLAYMPVEIVNEYLKTKTHCSQNTINGYADSIKKIFRCAEAVYKTGDFTEMRYINKPLSDRDKEATLRDIALSREVHNAALNNMSKTSGGYVGNLLNGILGS